MILHSIISEMDIFYTPAEYAPNGAGRGGAGSAGTVYAPNGAGSADTVTPQSNVVPCVTDPALILRGGNRLRGTLRVDKI